ncbi:MAG: hypothetical protein Q7R72_00260 [bacterium]|nr:hypothetical protein [bacterium]
MKKENLSAILPFTEDMKAPLFLEVLQKLKDLSNPLTAEDLFQIYLEARGHILHLMVSYGVRWEQFRQFDIIDVENSAQNFYNVAFSVLRLSISNMSPETAEKVFNLTMARENQWIAQATNAFLNAMIQELKEPDPALAYASV